MIANPVRGRLCSPGFGAHLAGAIKQVETDSRSAASRQAQSMNRTRHWDALDALRRYVAPLPPEDQRLAALELLVRELGCFNSQQLTPRGEILTLLARVGLDSAPPDSPAVLEELVQAAAEMVVRDSRERYSKAAQDAQQANARAEKAAPWQHRAEQAEQRVREFKTNNTNLADELTRLRRQVVLLEARNEGEPVVVDVPTDEPKQRKKRAKIEGLAGVMLTELADDSVQYEVLAPDPETGKRRWFVFESSEAAVDFRDKQDAE